VTNIDTKGMEVARLSEEQLNSLTNAEREINGKGANQEVYLLAVSRHVQK